MADTRLVTFRSEAWSSVTLFRDVAEKLLHLMGHSGTIPSAIMATDVATALAKLTQQIGEAAPQAAPSTDGNEPPPVSLRQRAYPLIQLLRAAVDRKADVMWE